MPSDNDKDDSVSKPPAEEAASLENVDDTKESTEVVNEAAQSLETPDSSDANQLDKPSSVFTTTEEPTDEKVKKDNKLFSYLKSLDRYVLIFVVVLLITFGVIFLIIQKNKTPKTPTTNSSSLSQSALEQLNSNDIQVGGTQQVLNIASDTIFNGSALVKNGLQVANTLKVSGTSALQSITASGNSQLNQISGSSIVISGSSTLKGQLIVGGSLAVSGSSTFGSANITSLTANNVQINGDLNIEQHIVTSGTNPGITSLSGIGSGGTVSINGTDTTGTIDINFGTGPSNACDAAITFTKSYGSTPRVIISPSNASASNVSYYVSNKTKNGFYVCSSSPNASSSANFDYIVID